jgi:hypothetical protein
MLAELRQEREQVNEALAYSNPLLTAECKRRGRPPAWMTAVKQRGMPPGSKNKPKDARSCQNSPDHQLKLQPGSVVLTESVPRVRDCERTILLRRQLDPICLAVMDWRGRRTWTELRGRHRSNGHRWLLIINRIGDEHSRHRVLLSAQE